MRVDVRTGNRVVSCLDSAPSSADVAQGFTPATSADASQAFSPRHVLLLLHAFPLNASMWEAQTAAPPPGWRFVAPDMRGCGRSQADSRPDSTSLSLDDYARDVVELLDRLAIDRVVVAGLSMGGYTALALLRVAPSRVAGLVLCNTKTEADTEEAKNGRRDMLAVLAREGVAGVADRSIARLLGTTTRQRRPEVERLVRDIALQNSREGVGAAIVRLMNRPDSGELLAAIRCPTLVIASEEDVITSMGQARTMKRAIAGADMVVVPEAGHLSNLEQPEQFDDALRRFLMTRFGD